VKDDVNNYRPVSLTCILCKVIITDWIKNVLTDCKQRVRVNGEFSHWAKVLSGIPPESILGPLLFIIFINDLVEIGEENIKLYLFADDAKIYCHVKNLTDKDNLQRGIENLVDCTNRWQVSLNINKCKLYQYIIGNTLTCDWFQIMKSIILYWKKLRK